MTSKEFIESIAPTIKTLAKKNGYSYPSAIIAQAALESGYGSSLLASKYHNYFGMKCGSSWTGKSVNMSTKEEYKAGVTTDIKANFRVYDSMKAGVQGYFDFISASRYKNLKSATSSKNYLELLKDDGYATSSTYVESVYAVALKYDLLEYDGTKKSTTKKTSTGMTYDEALDTLADSVIAGDLGSGTKRKNALYTKTQKAVNAKTQGTFKATTAIEKAFGVLADYAIKGAFGDGMARKDNIYKAVQKVVNKKLG